MRRVVTQADFLAHLQKHCIKGVEDPYERIMVYMSGVREDLASAAADLDAVRSRTATSNIEDAAMLMGEAIGYAFDYKVPAGEGHHWVAIQILRLYVQSCVPPVSRLASQLDLLRTYRHRVKYDGADAPMEQTRLYFGVVKAIYDAIKNEPLRILSERQAGFRTTTSE